MVVKVNFDNMSINDMKMDSKAFKNNLATIIKGKMHLEEKVVNVAVGSTKNIPTKRIVEVYNKPTNVESIEFYSDRLGMQLMKLGEHNFIQLPLRKEYRAFLTMCIMEHVPATVNGRKLTNELCNQIEETSVFFAYDSSMHKESEEVVNELRKDNTLWTMYLQFRTEPNVLDIIREYIENYIKASGYDVGFTSNRMVEGKVNYKFYDGYTTLEGSKSTTKKYERYERTYLDCITLYKQVKEYEHLGIEPELPRQRHETIGLANSWRFSDLAELENFIEKEMHSGDVEQYEQDTHTYNASVEMLLS